jgi:NAD(P)-dependent dehydrogenase (short-subunit alcohol dehydrogenase family)
LGDDAGVQPVAVVTGGSSGIGAAIARALAAREWRCVLVARGRERLEAVAREVDGEWEACDVSDREQVAHAAAAIAERHPAIRLLVNNAGVPGRSEFLRADPELIERVLRINYLGGVWCMRAFLPALERARPAHVVNVVSVAGTVAFPPSGPYSAAKHAQLAFSRATAVQLRPRGVHVHTVCPGFVETEGFPQAAVLRNPLLRRLVVEPERVAERVIDVLVRDRTETFVPGWYRIAPLAQALAPGLLARLLARGGYRRMRSEADE